jgi:hypothetical protein
MFINIDLSFIIIKIIVKKFYLVDYVHKDAVDYILTILFECALFNEKNYFYYLYQIHY